MRTSLALSLALVLLANPPSRADVITPVAQARSAVSSAFVESFDDKGNLLGTDSDSDNQSAPDFAPFAVSVSASANAGTGSAGVGATQDSQILPDRLVGFGTSGGSASGGFMDIASSGGDSFFSVTFQLNEPATFDLSGSMQSFDDGNCILDFSGPAGEVEYYEAWGEIFPLSMSGNLAPGEYTFFISCSGGGYVDSGTTIYASAEFDFTLLFTPNATGTPVEAAGGSTPFAAPNPFRSSTRISMGADFEAAALPGAASAPASIRIFDAAGRLGHRRRPLAG